MKMLLGFGDWLSESEKKELTPEQEEFLTECTQGRWEFDSQTGEVNVEGAFDCSSRGLDDLKAIRFGRVSGNFDCDNNNLKSLVGAPQVVEGSFSCGTNHLESLVGAPEEVEGSFYCDINDLESLVGAPQQVGVSFNCENNDLKSLKGAPQQVGGYFSCSDNSPESLEGAPQVVGGSFYCDAFSLDKGEWNPKGWMKIFKRGKPVAQNLVMTLLGPEILNQEIQNDPQGMLQILKGVWDAEGFAEVQKELKFPDEFGDVDKTIRSIQKLDSMKDFI